MATCEKNPQNRFNCERCGKCFVGGQDWLGLKDGESLREKHYKMCDYIPCTYQLREAEIGDWFLMAPGAEGTERQESFDISDGHVPSKATLLDKGVEDAGGTPASSCTPEVEMELTDGIDEEKAEASSFASDNLVPSGVPDVDDSSDLCFHDANSSNDEGASESGEEAPSADLEGEDASDESESEYSDVEATLLDTM